MRLFELLPPIDIFRLKLKHKHKFVVMTFLGGQIIRTFVFRDCEVLIEGVVLKENLISLEIWDFEVILSMKWLSTHRASIDCFTKSGVSKTRIPKVGV